MLASGVQQKCIYSFSDYLLVKCLSTMWETWVLGWEDSLEKEMATHSSSLALKIPWTEKLCAGYYPWGRKKSGTNERLHFHFLHRLLQDIVSAYLFCRANRFACWEGRWLSAFPNRLNLLSLICLFFHFSRFFGPIHPLLFYNSFHPMGLWLLPFYSLYCHFG